MNQRCEKVVEGHSVCDRCTSACRTTHQHRCFSCTHPDAFFEGPFRLHGQTAAHEQQHVARNIPEEYRKNDGRAAHHCPPIGYEIHCPHATHGTDPHSTRNCAHKKGTRTHACRHDMLTHVRRCGHYHIYI